MKLSHVSCLGFLFALCLPSVSLAYEANADTEAAQAVLRAVHPQLARCLEGRALEATVHLSVAANGRADILDVTGTPDRRVASCLRRSLESIRFPEASRAATAKVIFPLRAWAYTRLPPAAAHLAGRASRDFLLAPVAPAPLGPVPQAPFGRRTALVEASLAMSVPRR
jgi:hypothetical protein